MVEITIIDEVSGKLEAPLDIFCEVVEAMKLPEKGAFMTAAFQSGNWDGKVSLMDEDGFFDVFMIDIIEKVLQRNGIRDEDIKFTDMRLPLKHSREELPDTIDKDFFSDYGVELWDHQVRFFNKFIDAECGIWDASTSSGKTLAMGGLAKLYDKFYPSLHLTVNQKLANDAAKVFKTLELDYVVITAKTPVKKRQELINTHRHIITTRKLAMNMKDCFDEFQGVLSLDESHIYGEEFHAFAKEKLGDCPIRLGLSGSLPDKDKLKLQRIKNVINGDVIDEVLPGYLMEKGYASTIDVRMIEIDDLIGKRKMFEAGDEWCWEMELAHYGTSERISVIGDFIEKNCPRNTLIITWNSTALELAKYLGCDVIVDSTPQAEREEYFAKFDEVDDYRLVVTPGTGGFGVSIDLLYYGVLLDIGENPSVAGQGIGRFMRKDHVNGLKDHSVVWDIFSNLKSGKKQATGRRAYYKKRGIPFQPKYGKLKVTE